MTIIDAVTDPNLFGKFFTIEGRRELPPISSAMYSDDPGAHATQEN